MIKQKTIFSIPVKLALIILFVLITGNLSAQSISIGNGTTFSLGTSTLSLPGDWLNSGLIIPGSGTVIFNGAAGNQTVSNASGGIFNNIIINKASGDLQLQNNIIINGTFEVTAGDLNLNGDTITLGANAFVSETPGNTVRGSGIITGAKLIDAPSEENVFGLGAVITSSSYLGLTVIKRGHTEQTGNGNQSILRYYEITPANNSGLNATVVFSYDNSELNGLNESNLKLYHSNGNDTTWILDTGILDTAANTVTLNNINCFSRWTLGEKLAGPITSNVPEEVINIPKDYSLSQNFPNPFNPITEIKFSLPEDGNVSLKIFNITGQLIKTLVDDNYKAGYFSVPWNGTDNFGGQVSSGIYFYRISASGTRQFTQTKKMVFLK